MWQHSFWRIIPSTSSWGVQYHSCELTYYMEVTSFFMIETYMSTTEIELREESIHEHLCKSCSSSKPGYKLLRMYILLIHLFCFPWNLYEYKYSPISPTQYWGKWVLKKRMLHKQVWIANSWNDTFRSQYTNV